MTIPIVVLAAGTSRRMGTTKQVLPAQDGNTLLQNAISVALATEMSPVVVVVGADKANVVPTLVGLPVTIVDNANWASGMASSVKVGLAAAYMMAPAMEGALFLVCDQPYITAALLNEMRRHYIEKRPKAVVCRYGTSWGVPVLVGSSLLADLTRIEGDQGAKPLLKKHVEDVVFLDFDLGAIDIDTPAEYQYFVQSSQ